MQVVPRDVLLKMVPRPVNAFLAEDEENAKLPINRVYLIALDIKGQKDNDSLNYSVSLPFTLYKTTEEKIDVYNKFGTMIIGVALPAVVGARMCVAGEADRGVICAECLDPVRFLQMMAEMGAPVKLREVVSKEVTF